MQDLAARQGPALALLSLHDFAARSVEDCNNHLYRWSYKVVPEGQRLEGSQTGALSVVES
jgi:hypothetical protein